MHKGDGDFVDRVCLIVAPTLLPSLSNLTAAPFRLLKQEPRSHRLCCVLEYCYPVSKACGGLRSLRHPPPFRVYPNPHGSYVTPWCFPPILAPLLLWRSLAKLSGMPFITMQPVPVGPCPSRLLYYSGRSLDRVRLNTHPYHCGLLPCEYP